MKVAIVLCAIVAYAAAATYTTKYDNIDLEKILTSDRLRNNYVNCLLDKGNCTPDGKELKKALPDALENGCNGCSEKQRAGSEKVIRWLVTNKPETWAELSKKYDPTGEYTKKFKPLADSAGIVLN